LKKDIDGNPNPKPDDLAQLDKKKQDFQNIADRALNDINPSKNLHLLGDPKGDELRKFLNDQIKDSESTPTPTPALKASPETKKLEDQIAQTKAKLDDYGKDLDGIAKKNQDEAKALSQDLPKALS